MDNLPEIIKLPIPIEGEKTDQYLLKLVAALRNMIEIIAKNSNTMNVLILGGGGAGVIDHGGLKGLTDGDHPATAIVNMPYVAGAIASTNVQAAINELADERTDMSHDHSGGDGAQINHTTLSNIGTNTHAQIDTHVGAAAPHTGHSLTGHTHSHHDLTYLGTDGDHTAADITNVAAGGIAATDVQAAINELDTEKAPLVHTHTIFPCPLGTLQVWDDDVDPDPTHGGPGPTEMDADNLNCINLLHYDGVAGNDIWLKAPATAACTVGDLLIIKQFAATQDRLYPNTGQSIKLNYTSTAGVQVTLVAADGDFAIFETQAEYVFQYAGSGVWELVFGTSGVGCYEAP